MNPRLSLAATVLLFFSLGANAEEQCRALQVNNPGATWRLALKDIQQAGQYCLERDVTAPQISSSLGSPFPAMLDVQASNVVVDLRGFAIGVLPGAMRGIQSGDWKNALAQQNITVRNGAINSTGPAISFDAPWGSLLADFGMPLGAGPGKQASPMAALAARSFGELSKVLPRNPDAYQKTGHLVDNLSIAVHCDRDGEACRYGLGIGMKGAANVIRNSTIEVSDGHAGIYLFGPNQLIENNVIVFRGRAAYASSAAIKLHQADGSIIRNNDIVIVDAGEAAPQAAIALIDSKNVLVEGNRMYGVRTLACAWGGRSSLIDRNNDFRLPAQRPPARGGGPGVP